MPKILIVDDSPLARVMVADLLQKYEGVELTFANDGQEALDFVSRNPTDIVLTDLQMPVVDGLELVKQLKELHPLVPVILMTAVGSEEIAVAALDAGAASYVPKRNIRNDLWCTVTKVLQMSEERRNNTLIFNRLERWETAFCLENNPDQINALLTFLMQGFASLQFCTQSDQLRVRIALDEALMNAYFHGNLEVPSKLREDDHGEFFNLAKRRSGLSPYQERRIRVSAKYSPHDAVFEVCDDGPGFDTTSLPDPRDPNYLDRPHGRGLLLMRTFMDEVQYNDQGNQVTLIKRSKCPANGAA